MLINEVKISKKLEKISEKCLLDSLTGTVTSYKITEVFKGYFKENNIIIFLKNIMI